MLLEKIVCLRLRHSHQVSLRGEFSVLFLARSSHFPFSASLSDPAHARFSINESDVLLAIISLLGMAGWARVYTFQNAYR